MKSMVKRKVEVSLNAHVEMIQQLVLDARSCLTNLTLVVFLG